MSRTHHKERAAKRGIGKEYWKSRLIRTPAIMGEKIGRITKAWTHRKERREAKRELQQGASL